MFCFLLLMPFSIELYVAAESCWPVALSANMNSRRPVRLTLRTQRADDKVEYYVSNS